MHAREKPAKFASACALAAASLALAVPLLGAAARPGYDHCSQFISELGERGAPNASWVNLAGFLPIGVLVVLFAVVAAIATEGWRARVGLLLFSGVGWAYVIAAFFPCDPGCPSPGSATQQIHSSGALAEYVGGGIGLWLASGARVAGASLAPRWLSVLAGGISFSAFVGLLSPAFASERGFVQRVAEVALFAWLAVAGWSLWRTHGNGGARSPAPPPRS